MKEKEQELLQQAYSHRKRKTPRGGWWSRIRIRKEAKTSIVVGLGDANFSHPISHKFIGTIRIDSRPRCCDWRCYWRAIAFFWCRRADWLHLALFLGDKSCIFVRSNLLLWGTEPQCSLVLCTPGRAPPLSSDHFPAK